MGYSPRILPHGAATYCYEGNDHPFLWQQQVQQTVDGGVMIDASKVAATSMPISASHIHVARRVKQLVDQPGVK